MMPAWRILDTAGQRHAIDAHARLFISDTRQPRPPAV